MKGRMLAIASILADGIKWTGAQTNKLMQSVLYFFLTDHILVQIHVLFLGEAIRHSSPLLFILPPLLITNDNCFHKVPQCDWHRYYCWSTRSIILCLSAAVVQV